MQQSRFSFHESDIDFNRLPPTAPGKLFIGGLSHDTTDASLRNFFDRFGTVVNAEVLRDHQTLNSRGFGFVTYANEEVAYEVVRTGLMRPFVVDGKPVEVKNAVPKESKNSSSEFEGSNPYAWPAKLQHYRTSSVSTTSTASPDPQQYSRTLARANTMKSILTTFPEEEGILFNDDYNFGAALPMNTTRTARAPTETSFSSVPLQRVYSMPAFASNSPANVIIPNKVFVGGLLYATGHESLRRYFEQFGEIECAEVIYNRDTKKSRGFGFVIFKTLEAVESVLLKQKNDRLVIDGKQIEVKLCKPRDDLGSDYGCYGFQTPTREREFSLHSSGEYKSDVDGLTDFLNDSSFFDDVTDAKVYSNDSTPMAHMSRHSFSYNPDRHHSVKSAWPGSSVRSRVGHDQYDNFCQNYGFASTLHTISETQYN